MDKHLIALLISIITIESLAQWCLQKKLSKKDDMYLIGGVVLYGIVGIIYYHMLKRGKKMAVANTLWNAGTEISVALLGFIFFKQTLKIEQIIGIILILFAMYLV
jgi:uncharacterized membrane protein